MTFSLTWLPDVLEAAGVKVAEVDGWQTRGHGDMGKVVGVLCHHTVGLPQGNMPSLRTLINGREDLPGPLAQLGLGRDGTYYIIAAGLCFHAGAGSWQSITTGNHSFIGIEAENTGRDDDPWPEVQMDAYHRGVAAILNKIGCSSESCAGHKEYALPHGRKPDPTFDMDEFRASVATLLAAGLPPPVLIPAHEPERAGQAARPTLRRGSAERQLVTMVQQGIGVDADGVFGGVTEAAVRAFQRERGLVPDGIVGPKTWEALDAATQAPSNPASGVSPS